MFSKIEYVVLLVMFVKVKSEGYYCPYTDLGTNGNNNLLYDYYETNNGYWTRTGETGWESLESYCAAKGDLSKHSDAGEWKCNDSYQMCSWNGNSCLANPSRRPDCKELCVAILNSGGPSCLGNCPSGSSDENMHGKYCGWTIPKSPGDILPPIITTTQMQSAVTATQMQSVVTATQMQSVVTTTQMQPVMTEASIPLRCIIKKKRHMKRA